MSYKKKNTLFIGHTKLVPKSSTYSYVKLSRLHVFVNDEENGLRYLCKYTDTINEKEAFIMLTVISPEIVIIKLNDLSLSQHLSGALALYR